MRWCRGKVGVEHEWGAWFNPYARMRVFWFEQRNCLKCGKKQRRSA